jgi:biopolymer transport protein ExbB
MGLIEQGGLMMWPLIVLSVPALGIILERLVFFVSNPFPRVTEEENAPLKTRYGQDQVPEIPGLFRPFFDALFSDLPADTRETRTTRAAREILFAFGRRLDFLSAAATAAPLLGLLGTVLGMVQAFSRLSAAHGAMDIGLLADGIWHALLTTAAGLVIAIPSLLAHQWFTARTRTTAFEMERYANGIIDKGGNSRP